MHKLLIIKNNKAVYILLLILIISGCKQKPEKFLFDISHDPNYVITLRDDLRYVTCAYRPAEYMALREVMNNSVKTAGEEEYLKALDSFKEGVYFEFRIGLKDGSNLLKAGIESIDAYKQRIHYLTYGMNKDFFIIKENNEKVYPISYKFINPDGLSNTTDFLFVFSKAQLNDTKNLDIYYTDHIFNITRDIHFSYPIQLINKVFQIKLN